MAKNDEWCEFCNDKIKDAIVKLKGREYEVCSHCKSLTVEDYNYGNYNYGNYNYGNYNSK